MVITALPDAAPQEASTQNGIMLEYLPQYIPIPTHLMTRKLVRGQVERPTQLFEYSYLQIGLWHPMAPRRVLGSPRANFISVFSANGYHVSDLSQEISAKMPSPSDVMIAALPYQKRKLIFIPIATIAIPRSENIPPLNRHYLIT